MEKECSSEKTVLHDVFVNKASNGTVVLKLIEVGEGGKNFSWRNAIPEDQDYMMHL